MGHYVCACVRVFVGIFLGFIDAANTQHIAGNADLPVYYSFHIASNAGCIRMQCAVGVHFQINQNQLILNI